MAPSLGFWEATSKDQPAKMHDPALDGLPSRNILYIDAYDSFSYNVVAMLEEVLKATVSVLRIDSSWPNGNMVDYLQHFEAIVLGPGPGDPHIPQDVGIMRDIWTLDDRDLLPIFGICLGFQSLCLHHGASIRRLPFPIHGQVRRVQTIQKDIFQGVQSLDVTLYHSLYAEMKSNTTDDGHGLLDGFVAKDLSLLAWLSVEQDSGVYPVQIPMAVRHTQKPFWAVQFHPESCKSDRRACSDLLKRWWDAALCYNKLNGRGSHSSIPIASPRLSSEMPFISDICRTMLDWSESTSNKSSFRTFATQSLEAETIWEALNSPGSAAVLFKSNGRYSILSVPSDNTWRLEYYAQNERLSLEKSPAASEDKLAGNHQAIIEDGLSVSRFWNTLRFLMDAKKVVMGDNKVPFWAGFLGYVSYEMGLASIACPKSHEQDFLGAHASSGADRLFKDPADVSLLWTERSVVVDHHTGRVTIQSTRATDDVAHGWLDETLLSLQKLATTDAITEVESLAADEQFLDQILEQGVVRFPDRHIYQSQFDACRAQLLAGESYELCLTCETTVTLPSADSDGDRKEFPWKLYRRLQKHNPASFSAYANLGKLKIASSSPECFLNWDRHSMLEMKPMKGTVRKTKDMTLEKACSILGATKEMAENLMIADLIRHDLYGICGSGGVHVEKLLEVEDHGRVFQMITHVVGQVDPERPGFAVHNMPHLGSSGMSAYGLTALQQCLPPGSMTGAPKERSCLHLSSIENRKRGVYSGAMGFLDLGGGGSFSVLIRTAFTCADDDDTYQVWRVGAGGAVTILSTAEGEWEEMLTKLRTVLGAFVPLGCGPSKAA
ncbi:aminodeoxychorismate synthase pabA [Aspergillus saccharolyticus JOP 1030-1]|uniref:aminodeoxychorismate synthase n=1 Tax=Aspergillus saccharolyticus JOP 1030-1 TaxID=1450539 RepID=A0A318ZV67_9EURO|nr:para aminobenzoic acid synthetase [Aspergillus saccharolyticus JOP 1030-1]PYH48263.1 para aminobenzoic acid synthetase [Aspergillus saccharolyticus JOP 1030-1]